MPDDVALNVDDVFNDIDSMFQGLAQELDQMLMSWNVRRRWQFGVLGLRPLIRL
jgi:hypothetical protein